MGTAWYRSHRPHGDHAHGDNGQRRLSDCGFDAFETQVLDTARHFFLAFSEPQSFAWIEAFRKAELAFPVPFGATIANAILVAINDLRVSRLRKFSYQNPTCKDCSQSITDEERYFISALNNIRRGKRSAAETDCMLLCEGGDTSSLMASLERIAIITGDVKKPEFN